MTTVHNVPQINYLLIERALLGVVPLDELNPEEKDFCDQYKSVFEVGRMAGRMAQGYYAHAAAIEVATDPERDMSSTSTIISTTPAPIRKWLLTWNASG